MKILVETRIRGSYIDDAWYPDYVGEAVAETENRYGVKKRWYSIIEWEPKNGTFVRCKIIKDL